MCIPRWRRQDSGRLPPTWPALEVQAALKGKSDRVLDSHGAALMLTPGVAEMIGIGFFLSGKGEAVRFGHDGMDEGFVALMLFYKQRGLGAVVMVNSDEGFPILTEMAGAIAQGVRLARLLPRARHQKKLKPDTLDGYVGAYETKSNLPLIVSRKGNTLSS